MTAVFFLLEIADYKAMDTRLFKIERTHCDILKATFSYQEEKGTFPVDYSPSACVNTRFHGVQPYDHTKEAAQDSSAQNVYINTILGFVSVTWPSIVYYSVC